MMVNRKTTSALIIAALLACALPARSITAISPILSAQTPQRFPVPESVPTGASVRITSGSDGMNAITKALGSGFETQYPNSRIAIATKDTAAAALQDVLNDNADLAAISRPLTAAEKAKGLIEVPVLREKIAIAVSKDNPFAQSLTVSQFAQIFRGEIKDWAEVGGSAGAIQVIDRPESSEIRQSLQPYPAFTTAEFKTGDNATQLTDDSTESLAEALGTGGIGYAPIAQLENQPTLRALELHQTPPTNPRYPFSQPYSFVYTGGAPLEIAAFLGYATGKPGQAVLSQVSLAGSEDTSAADTAADGNATAAAGTTIESEGNTGAEGETAATPDSGQTDSATDGTNTLSPGEMIDGQWWWLLLPLVGLGLFIWAASSRSSEEETTYATDARPDDDKIRSSFDSDSLSDTAASDLGSPPIAPASAVPAIATETSYPEASNIEANTDLVADTELQATGVSAGEPALKNVENERSAPMNLDNTSTEFMGSSAVGAEPSFEDSDSFEDSGSKEFSSAGTEPHSSDIGLGSGSSSWLDRAKTRINEATDQIKETSTEDDFRQKSSNYDR